MNSRSDRFLQPNETAVKKFLIGLGFNPDKEKIFFATLDDMAERKSRELRADRLGMLDDVMPFLSKQSFKGAGVYVVVNRCTKKRRWASSVSEIMALYVDCDDDIDGEKLRLVMDAPLSPTMVVRTSPGRWHAYWRVTGCPIERFKHVQRSLIDMFGTDKSINDPSRIMRLPGFLNYKHGDPCRAEIMEYEPLRRYDFKEFIKAFGIKASRRRKPQANGDGWRASQEEVENIIEDLLDQSEAQGSTMFEKYPEWNEVLMAIHDWDPGDEGLEMAIKFSADDRCGGELDEDYIKTKWSEEHYGKNSTHPITFGTLFYKYDIKANAFVKNDDATPEEEFDTPELQAVREAALAKKQKARESEQEYEESDDPTFSTEFLPASAFGLEHSVEWLWKGWMPLGVMTGIVGDSGIGKTTIITGIVAAITSKGLFPDGTRVHKPGCVIYVSDEDDCRSIINPRLAVAGADLDNVFYPPAIVNVEVRKKQEKTLFNLATHIKHVLDFIRSRDDIVAIVVDPLLQVIQGDSNNASDVRRGLAQLVIIAKLKNIAIIGVLHDGKNKETPTSPERDNIAGSHMFKAKLRSVVSVIREPGSTSLIVYVSKTNYGKRPPALQCDIIPRPHPLFCEDEDKVVIYASWLGEYHGELEEVLAALNNPPEPIEHDDETREDVLDKLSPAEKIIMRELKDTTEEDPVDFTTLRERCEKHEISKRVLERACASLKNKHHLIGSKRKSEYPPKSVYWIALEEVEE